MSDEIKPVPPAAGTSFTNWYNRSVKRQKKTPTKPTNPAPTPPKEDGKGSILDIKG